MSRAIMSGTISSSSASTSLKRGASTASLLYFFNIGNKTFIRPSLSHNILASRSQAVKKGGGRAIPLQPATPDDNSDDEAETFH